MLREKAGFFQTEKCGEGNLAGRGIFTRRLTELFGALGCVEDVVLDLKGDTESEPKAVEGRDLRFGSAGGHCPQLE